MSNLSRPRPLPPGVFRGAFDLVVARLTQPGSELSRYVQTWQFSRGDDGDDVEPPAWDLGMFPLLRLELEGGPGGWFNQVTQKTDVGYEFTLAVAGTDQREVMDYWEAVVRRLYPGDGSLYSALKPLGVMSYSVAAVGVGRQKYPGGGGQIARGRLTLHTEFRTKY